MLTLIADELDATLPWWHRVVPDLHLVTARELGAELRLGVRQHAGADSRRGLATVERIESGPISNTSPGVRGGTILCRLGLPSVDHLGLSGDDREYALAEWTALLAAWLDAHGDRVLNRPSPVCLAGRLLDVDEWALRAGEVGIDVETTGRVTSLVCRPVLDDAIVVGDRVFSRHRLHGSLADGLARLAADVGARICGFSADGDWGVGRLRDLVATPVPDMAAIGADGATAVRRLVSAVAAQTGVAA